MNETYNKKKVVNKLYYLHLIEKMSVFYSVSPWFIYFYNFLSIISKKNKFKKLKFLFDMFFNIYMIYIITLYDHSHVLI